MIYEVDASRRLELGLRVVHRLRSHEDDVDDEPATAGDPLIVGFTATLPDWTAFARDPGR